MQITGLIMAGKRSFVKVLLRWFADLGAQVGQLQKRLDSELARGLRRPGGGAWQAPVGPLAGDGVAAPIGMAENEGIGARDASRLEDLKALAAQRVERMGDRGPSQTGIVSVCS